MTKNDLVKILESIGVPCNEGIQSDINTNENPRIVYWEYYWEPISASGSEYTTKVTYQVSFFSNEPRDSKLIELRKAFLKKGILIAIEHEYVEEDRCFHSFFSVEVLENIE